MTTVNESYLKEWFLAKLKSDQRALSFVVEEMQYADGRRRADLVLHDGCLRAVEIKSDVDSLSKLDGQIQDYLKIFERVSCLTTEKHLSNVLSIVPPQVGIFCFKNNRVMRVRSAKKNPYLDKYHMLTLIPSKEIDKHMRVKRLKYSNLLAHEKRFALAEKSSLFEIKSIIYDYLNKRYSRVEIITHKFELPVSQCVYSL